jgi:hypothetical protein
VTTDAFPAEAGPTVKVSATPTAHTQCVKWDRLQPGRGRFAHPEICGVTTDAFPAEAGPTIGAQDIPPQLAFQPAQPFNLFNPFNEVRAVSR